MEKRRAAREGEQEHRSQHRRHPAATATPGCSPASVHLHAPTVTRAARPREIDKTAATIEQSDESFVTQEKGVPPMYRSTNKTAAPEEESESGELGEKIT
jgi:hypothetical protein